MFGKRGLPFLMGPSWQAERVNSYNTGGWDASSTCSQATVPTFAFSSLTSGRYSDFGVDRCAVQGLTTGNKLFLGNPGAPQGGIAAIYPCPPNIIDSSNDYSYVTSNGDGWNFVALRADGTVMVNGFEAYGEYGLGNTGVTAVNFTAIPGEWSSFRYGGSNTGGIKNGGSLWTCGWNLFGQLGIGNSTDSNVHVQVGSQVWIDLAIGGTHMLGLRSDNTVWSWGNNGNGQLGLNDGVSRNEPYPVLVTPCTRIWAGASMSAFLTTDGDLFVCGRNSEGQLGLGGIYTGQNVADPTLLVHHDDNQVVDVTFTGTGFGIAVLMANGDIWSSGEQTGTELFTTSPTTTLQKAVTFNENFMSLPGAIWGGYNQSFVIPAANL